MPKEIRATAPRKIFPVKKFKTLKPETANVTSFAKLVISKSPTAKAIAYITKRVIGERPIKINTPPIRGTGMWWRL